MPLQVIPVIDLLGGQVVRGVAGRRDQYRPIVSGLTPSAEPGPIAAALTRQFDPPEIYVADLDAITRQSPDLAAWQAVGQCGLPLLLDAGIANLASAQRALAPCTTFSADVTLVIGLESLTSWHDLEQLLAYAGPGRIIFSLDLRQGQPLTSVPDLADKSASVIADWAVETGIKRMIVLDLAGVGVSQGVPTLSLCRQLHRRHPALRIISGGGVRGVADLQALEDAGCEGALVASALHDGTLTPADLLPFLRTDGDRAQ